MDSFLFSGWKQMLYDAPILKGAPMSRFGKYSVLLSVLLLTFCIRHPQTTMAGNPPAEGKEVVLKAADVTSKIFPERVFFRGQSAPVQFRNSGGEHFADGLYVLAGMVDSSGSTRGAITWSSAGPNSSGNCSTINLQQNCPGPNSSSARAF